MKPLSLLMALLWSFNLMAQQKDYGEYVAPQPGVTYKVGLTGGVNAAQLRQVMPQLQQIVRSHLLWQYNAGLALEQRFSPHIALSYQLLYSKQGSSTPLTGSLGNDRVVNQFDYISLPIMLRLNRGASKFFLEVGGQGSYLVEGKGYFASSKNQASTFHHVHRLDFGLTGGVGYRLSNHFVMDARYYHGLNPILADYTAPAPQTGIPTAYQVVKWYNRVYSMNLSYYF